MLQCGAVRSKICCGVLRCVATVDTDVDDAIRRNHDSACVAMCCNILQCVATVNESFDDAIHWDLDEFFNNAIDGNFDDLLDDAVDVHWHLLCVEGERVCVAVCCSVKQCVAVNIDGLQDDAVDAH